MASASPNESFPLHSSSYFHNSNEEAQSLLKEVPSTPVLEDGAWGTSDSNINNPGAGDKALLFAQSQFTHRRSRRFLILALSALVGCAILIALVTGWLYHGTSSGASSVKFKLDHIFDGTFYAHSVGVRWVPEAGDGVFAVHKRGVIQLVNLEKNETSDLVLESAIMDPAMPIRPLRFTSWALSPKTTTHLLLKAHSRKQWRHSSIGQFYIHHIASAKTYPLFDDYSSTFVADEAYAEWLPEGDGVVFVRGGDLYVSWLNGDKAPTDPTRITTTSTGNSSTTTMFNGVPDWVYEEEVLSGEKAFWISLPPDDTIASSGGYLLAYLTLNSSLVDTYTYPLYNPGSSPHVVEPYLYPKEMKIPYPKPGRENPRATVNVVKLARDLSPISRSLTWSTRLPSNDSIIQEVNWVGEKELMVKEVDRSAVQGSVLWFGFEDYDDIDSHQDELEGTLVRTLGKHGEEGDDGWIECNQNSYPLSPSLSSKLQVSQDGLSSSKVAYLDIVPTKEGWNHIALFSPASSTTPIFLTSGDWEIDGGILGVSIPDKKVYFRAAKKDSIERGIYAVDLPLLEHNGKVAEVEPLSKSIGMDEEEEGYWGANFSPEAGYFVLSYSGPGVPWQEIRKTGEEDFDYPLSKNEKLKESLTKFQLPETRYGTVEVDGYELNYKEMRPPHMDDSGAEKYPVFFQVYGGPASQMVKKSFSVHYMDYITAGMNYVTVIVDGRGTGFKGRKLRNPVKNDLGFWETHDQVAVAKIWSEKPYVDKKRIGIWGWSYGGFMAGKVAETDAGIHSLAISVAPVTSWRLYDSIYTERYMGLPEANPGGYVNASISNVTGFGNIDYLLAHGSGDDNVHFANSARLVDMLTFEEIRGWRFRMFTDSDHGISMRGANHELYHYMVDFLNEKWGNKNKKGWTSLIASRRDVD